MAMSNMRQDRENDKFQQTAGGDTAVRVLIADGEFASETTLLDILAAVDGLEGNTDGIEASLTAIAGQVYTEGDVDTTITGRAILAEDVSTSTLKTFNTKQLSTQVTSSDWGVVTNTVIHGLTTAGGGSFVDVKVNPSGALTVASTQDGTWNITNITGTVSLPTGASTSALQTAGNASLASIDTKLTSPIQVQTIAGSAGSTQLETLLYASKTITTTASLVNVSGSNQADRILLTIQPTNGTIYVGSDSSVTTSSGTPVESGSFFPMYVTATCDVYAICASGTVNIRIMEGSDQ